MDNLSRLASEQEPANAAASVRRHHDKVAAKFMGRTHDRFGRRVVRGVNDMRLQTHLEGYFPDRCEDFIGMVFLTVFPSGNGRGDLQRIRPGYRHGSDFAAKSFCQL
jgi:hypothetical protein